MSFNFKGRDPFGAGMKMITIQGMVSEGRSGDPCRTKVLGERFMYHHRHSYDQVIPTHVDRSSSFQCEPLKLSQALALRRRF